MVCKCHPKIGNRLLQYAQFGDILGKMTAYKKTPSSKNGITSVMYPAPFQRPLSTTTSDTSDYIEKLKRKEVRGLPIIHHSKYVSPLPLDHRFAMKKFEGVLRFLRIDNVISMNQVILPDKISAELTSLVHDPDYVHRFFSGQTTAQEQKMTGFPWSEQLVDRCRYETGGTVLAAALALERGIACSTGGGTHHAFPAYGSGYCLINDMAIAAATLLHQKFINRVLILDLDVHQGDGTAVIFENDNRVFTFSMHCEGNFPVKKQHSDLDIGLCNGMEDKEYQQLLEDHLPWVVETFRPDLVIYDAGVDPHVKDELGKLNLTDKGLFSRDHYVLSFLASKGIPCATVIGGGYSRELDELSRRHTIVHRAAAKVWKDKGL